MAQNTPLARRLRLGIIGDGAGPIDADQLGAATAFRTLDDGDVARHVPSFGAGPASAVALDNALCEHAHVLVFDAQLPSGDTTTPDALSEALSWLLNQGVDMVVFCQGCDSVNHNLNAALDRGHRFGVTLLSSVTTAWPASHAAVIGVAAQPDASAGLQWLGGDTCSVLHQGTSDPAAAVGEVASVLLTGVAQGLVRNDLIDHVREHCLHAPQRRAS